MNPVFPIITAIVGSKSSISKCVCVDVSLSLQYQQRQAKTSSNLLFELPS